MEEAFDETTYSTPITFEDKKVIFITMRFWGIGDQHFHTVISDVDHTNNNTHIDKEKEIVLDGVRALYYKIQEPDSLLIFLPLGSHSDKIENKQIGKIKVKITEIDNKNFEYPGLISIEW